MKKESPIVKKLIYEMQLRNYSLRSIKTYSSLMSKLEKKFNQTLDKITSQQFKHYLHHRITADSVSVSTINQYISAFRIVQVDVLHRKFKQFNIKRPRRTKKLPVILSVDEVEKLLSVVSNVKHKALLMLAYSSGLRRHEIQKIKPKDIDSARMQVHVVQGKGKKDRYTILSTKALDMLRYYYKLQHPKEFLFESFGRKGVYLSETTLSNIVKNNAKKAGIQKNISFHTLRHCFATHLIETGVSLPVVQQFMGHTSIKTTTTYLHLTNISPSSVVSPLDSMNI